MALLCAISGNVPEEPVVSIKSGHVFEKSLITKYVSETGKDPISGQELAQEDLLPLNTNKTVKPRTSPQTSIPGMLGLFHDEWDALMLEHHTLRQNLHTVRQELSHALYQHDAACRVIARLLRERDEARTALETLREDMRVEFAAAAEARKRAGEDEEGGPAKRSKGEPLPDAVLEVLNQTNAELSSGRRKRAIPEGTATPEGLASFTLKGSFPLHKTTQPGILALALHPTESNLLATCGADATVQLFDLGSQRQLTTLTGHTKRVTAAVWGQDNLLVSASNDKSLRFWKHTPGEGEAGSSVLDGSWECAATATEHSAEVRGLALHPSRVYGVSVSADASWAWWDLAEAKCVKQMPGASPYTGCAFHPDGLLMLTGTADAKAQIWEMRQQKAVTGFDAGSGAPFSSFSFSENGYHVATAGPAGVSIWDLRKMKCYKDLSPFEEPTCRAACYDFSSQYLAVGGSELLVYATKQDWSVVKSWPDVSKKGVLSVAWAPLASSLLVGCGDHNLRVFGPAGEAMQE